MQAVVLAAGMGRRLGALTERSTKFMVQLNGRPLAGYMLDAVVEAGVDQIVLVVGHGADEVRAYVGEAYRGVPVAYVENAEYATTNNIQSLLLARAYLEQDDTLLLESDLIFEPEVLAECLASPAPNLAVVARHEPWMDGTVVLLDASGHIAEFVSKRDFDPADRARYFKTVNIYKLSRAFCRERFMPFLPTYMALRGRNAYYEDVLKVLVFMGGEPIAALPMGDRRWYEIDDVQDLDIAEALFAPDDERPARFHGRYGGYWRFERLVDFCYLVNPYFPPRRLLDELEHALPKLLTQYPSGMRVQRLLASRLFGCNPAAILVGNGASELIRALMPELPGPIGVPIPTFEEYPQTAPAGQLVEFAPGPDFAYTADDLLAFARERRLGTLVLVNPDNPSGQFLPRAEVLRLAEGLAEAGTRLVLDESFVDFVDGTAEHGLLRAEVLARWPGLVVLKSISKSYGVPGLRLGMLACGDLALVERVRARLPIWNVNSFAEWFLQMIGRFDDEYEQACRELAAVRQELFDGLGGVPFLRPLPSAANYVLCELRDGWTSRELGRRLLNEHWLLIKECGGKRGFGEAQYARFAVRDRADNARLLEALHALARSGAAAAVGSRSAVTS